MKEEDFLFSCTGYPQAHGIARNATCQAYYLIVLVIEFTVLPSHSALHFFPYWLHFMSSNMSRYYSSWKILIWPCLLFQLLSWLNSFCCQQDSQINGLWLPSPFAPHQLFSHCPWSSFLTTPLKLHPLFILADQSLFCSSQSGDLGQHFHCSSLK